MKTLAIGSVKKVKPLFNNLSNNKCNCEHKKTVNFPKKFLTSNRQLFR